MQNVQIFKALLRVCDVLLPRYFPYHKAKHSSQQFVCEHPQSLCLPYNENQVTHITAAAADTCIFMFKLSNYII
jgi:hypothetical protein